MCGNPFKLMDRVDGNFEVEKITTSIIGYNAEKLTWREDNGGYEILTLNEILEQIEQDKNHYKNRLPFIRIVYETGLWGVIFEIGNYPEIQQWTVHGITKRYA